jgi:GT2 family glycosyltransferase
LVRDPIADELGIVAIGRNEGERLINCLQSLRSQTSNIIYVDSGSVDGSVTAAQRLGIAALALDPRTPFTAARARNEGFDALKQISPQVRFIQFVDGDCILTKSWLETALSFLREHPDIAAVCGRRRERYPLTSVYNKLADDEWDTPIGEATACGGDALFRRDAYEAVGGFRPTLIAGEEPELCLRLREKGWKIWRLDADMTSHDMAMSRFGQWWSRTVRCGYATAEVWWLHRRSPESIWGRQTASAVIWGAILPIAIVTSGSLIHPALLAISMLYPIQVVRIATNKTHRSAVPFAYALFTVIGKFAAFEGLLRLCWRRLTSSTARLIEYK